MLTLLQGAVCASDPDQFEALLRQDNIYLKCYAIHNIAYRHPERIKKILPLASDPEPMVRKAVYFSIGLDAGPEHLALFRRGLKDSDPEVRRYALMGLANIEAGKNLDLATGRYRDPDPRVREMLAMAAGRYRHRPLLGHMVRLLDDPSPRVARAAATAIGRIGDRRALKYLQQYQNRLEKGGESKTSRRLEEHAEAVLKIHRNFPFGFSYFPQLIKNYQERVGLDVVIFEELSYAVNIGADSPANLDNIKLSIWNLDGEETLNRIVNTVEGYWYIDMGRVYIAPGSYRSADSPLELEVAYALGRLGDKSAVKVIKSYTKHKRFGPRARKMLKELR